MARSSTASSVRIANVLFEARLHREGRLHEYWEAKAKLKEESRGLVFGSPESIAASQKPAALKREFGYLNPKDEFEREKELLHKPIINRRKAQMAEIMKNKGRTALDKAFDALPNRASNDAEMAWVGSHPKMRRAQEHRLQNPGDDPEPVKMVVADITSPSNGPCPSKVAYTTLVAWLSDPKEFQKQMISKQRDAASKGMESSAEEEGVVFDDLGEAERMLEAASRNDG